MKNFFHLLMSVILGSCLGYGLYFKILKKGAAPEANNIAVDELFFADNIAFEKKQQEMLTLSATSKPYVDTLQVNIQFFETPQPVKTASVSAKSTEIKPVKIIEAMRPIEVSQLQKPKTISLPVSKIAAPEIIETASVSVQVTPAVQEISTSATTAGTDLPTQEQSDKKRFLFFSKKNRNN